MASGAALHEDKPAAIATKIAIRHLGKRFATRHQMVTAIDDLSLDIAVGEFFMIVGPSGCGKTTLLRILAGLDDPSEGELRAPIYVTSTLMDHDEVVRKYLWQVLAASHL